MKTHLVSCVLALGMLWVGIVGNGALLGVDCYTEIAPYYQEIDV